MVFARGIVKFKFREWRQSHAFETSDAYRCSGVRIHFLRVTTFTQIGDLRSVSLQRCANSFFACDYVHTDRRLPKRIAAAVCEFNFCEWRRSHRLETSEAYRCRGVRDGISCFLKKQRKSMVFYISGTPEMVSPCRDQKINLLKGIYNEINTKFACSSKPRFLSIFLVLEFCS